LADRVKTEWQAIVDLLAGRSRERILLFEGASGLGKSVLVRHAVTYAKKLEIPVAWVDFKGGVLDVAAVLEQFDLDLGAHLPKFSQQGADNTHLLRKDLRALRQPVLIIFDGYEAVAENKPVADWLCQQLLNEIETALGLAVIVAGQRVPDPMSSFWRELARHLQLGPITELEHWEPWIERRYPTFRDKGAHLPTVLMIAHGNPAVITTSCEAIAKS
jgi:KaiC/GvpD/RAD55 family RecA-like ATPase